MFGDTETKETKIQSKRRMGNEQQYKHDQRNKQTKKNIPTNKEYINIARLTGSNREIKEMDREREKGM